MAIETRVERKRGCGWRKPGGLYLMADGLQFSACGKLPIRLDVCPTCGHGVKPSRSWTWVNGTALTEGIACTEQGSVDCARCPLSKSPGRVGLIWIGGTFYETPADWIREAREMGVSRRIPAVPNDFELGTTWVWVAHRKVIENSDGTWTPAVFHAFLPTAVEYVVKGDETPEEIERLQKRGITPVDVKRAEETPPLFDESAELFRPDNLAENDSTDGLIP